MRTPEEQRDPRAQPSPANDGRRLTPVVHARGSSGRVDALLDLMSFLARPSALSTALDELPRRITRLFPCDVCSIYLLEGDELVMRGNLGFPAEALGEVRLAVGCGITGLSVECMRPLSLDVAASHASNRVFPGLGEERFPIFMAVPVAGPRGPLGALVLRRREPPAFTTADLELAVALTAPIAAMVERAHIAATRHAPEAAGHVKRLGVRRVTLSGRPVVGGRALGTVCALRRPSTHAKPSGSRAAAPETGGGRHPTPPDLTLGHVFSSTRRAVDGLERRAKAMGLDVSFLGPFRYILDDARLQQRVLEHAEAGSDLAHALSVAGAEASRAAARGEDAFGMQRARAINDICEAMAMMASKGSDEMPRDAILVGDEVTLFDLLVSARYQPAGVVVSQPPSGLASSLLCLLGVPAVGEVAGLFRWVSDGDIALVDGDHGLVRVNPGRAEISSVRAERKRRAQGPPRREPSRPG